MIKWNKSWNGSQMYLLHFLKECIFCSMLWIHFSSKKDELLWFSVSQHSSGMKNWITSEVARVWKVSRIALQSFKLIFYLPRSSANIRLRFISKKNLGILRITLRDSLELISLKLISLQTSFKCLHYLETAQLVLPQPKKRLRL